MSGTLERFTFEDADGNEFGSFYTDDPDEARKYAQENRVRWIAQIYEWSDSELVEDYTGTEQ